jgi:ankyrin repeat protein
VIHLHAVKKGDTKSVAALLQNRATPTAIEPSTGQSALTAAFAANSVNTAKLLLAYGGNPDEEDKAGRTARGLASKNSELSDLIKKWDNQESEAFEVPLKPELNAL